MNLTKSAAITLALGCVGALHAGPSQLIEYKQVEGGPLTLHCFFPKDHSPSDKSPTIVFFFGGGWKMGKPGQFYPQCQYLATQGMVAISAQYRTKSSHNTGPKEAVQDGRSALRYVRTHAAELGIDPDKILAGGGSAGGHVAACTAIPDAPDEPGEDPSVPCRPVALVLFNPVLDVGPEGYANGYVKNSVKEWETISPHQRISEDFPPTLVQVGTVDKVLPLALAQNYEAQMKADGVRCDLEVYEGQEHGFFNKPEFSKLTLQRADAFIRSLGYLKGAASDPPAK